MVLIFDGGQRRGEDIIKARVAGADFVMVGRPFLYGLGAAGEKGIHCITNILAVEADIPIGLIGETELTAIGLQNLATWLLIRKTCNDPCGYDGYAQCQLRAIWPIVSRFEDTKYCWIFVNFPSLLPAFVSYYGGSGHGRINQRTTGQVLG